MNKENMIYTFNTLLFSLKKKGILFIRMWMGLENITLWNKSNTKYKIICMILSYVESKLVKLRYRK